MVVLLDHGRHASLVVENAAGTPVRYSYGDRRWYADEDFSIRSALAALFMRTPAVVTRYPIDADPEPAAILAAVDWVNENVYVFEVDAARADPLLERLERMFTDDDRIAPHPKAYSVFGNSNHQVAAWLEALGCEASPRSPLSRWRVRG